MARMILPARIEEIGTGVEFIEERLKKYRIKDRDRLKAMLVAEEAMVRLVNNASEGAELQISVRHRFYGETSVTVSAQGTPFDSDELEIDLSEGEMAHDDEEAVRSLLLHAMADQLAYSHRGDYNYVKISVGAQEQLFIRRTLISMLSGLVVAVLLWLLLPEGAEEGLVNRLLLPIQTIFLNSLQMVTAPAVFFSIMTAMARYSAFADSSRISLKVIVGYLLTSISAVLISVVLFSVIGSNVKVVNAIEMLAERSTWLEGEDETILNMVVNFIPSNIIAPFLNTDAMQLLFSALLAGIALGRAGRYSAMLGQIADALERFFNGMVEIVSNLIPTAVFFITVLMVLYFGLSSLLSAVELFAFVLLGFFAMLLFYVLLVAVIGRLNPLIFLRESWPLMRKSFLSSSGIATINDTMECCGKRLGISPKVYSFAIPFGTVANLDGNCVYLTTAGLFLARMCDVDMLGHKLFTVLFMVVVLSVGSPITPGSAMLALTMLMGQMGIPLAVLSFALGINVLLEMLLAVCNTVSDIAITLVVARTEKLLDLDIYRGRAAKS